MAPMLGRRQAQIALMAVVALMAVACAGSAGGGAAPRRSHRPKVDKEQPTAPSTFTVEPGVEIATVTGAEPGARLTLVNRRAEKLLTTIADDRGQGHFSYIPTRYTTFPAGEVAAAEGSVLAPGRYTIRNESTRPVQLSRPFTVLGVDDVPEQSFYDQDIGDGFGYVTTRDGVTLSINVKLPGPAEDGPYPTVIEYSGYGPSNPGATEPGSMIAGILGYATVGVNMRGSGCSGGVFDVFNAAQQADGYDAVEAIARQPWVLNNKVGMVGLSYSGIAQLYVAATRPPSLAAITPLSVIEDPWLIAWPGGIYNSGFTRSWLAERDRQSSAGGSSWVTKRIEGGDTTCRDNLLIRSQNIDFGAFTRALADRPPSADGRDLSLLVSKIDVPVYLTGAWQDEQTGPRFGTMLDRFTGTDHERFTLFNGRHPDGYTPLVLTRWFEFLEFYVHGKIPRLAPGLRAAAPPVFESFFGVPGLKFEDDRFTAFTDEQYDSALDRYEDEPKVRVLFENGAGGVAPGSPTARFEATFPSWPPQRFEARRWYLGPDGVLDPERDRRSTVEQFENEPAAGGVTFFADPDDYGLLAPTWKFDWQDPQPGTALSYLTAPMAADTVVAGAGYAELWVAADGTDADVQVTVTAVRPDGTEDWVQSGQLRLSHRAEERRRRGDLRIEHDYSKTAREALRPGRFVRARVDIPPFAQAFRTGTRLRVIISSPGRDRGTWEFDTQGDAGESRSVILGGKRASSLVLSVVGGITVPAGNPPCPSLRGQACRPYAEFENTRG